MLSVFNFWLVFHVQSKYLQVILGMHFRMFRLKYSFLSSFVNPHIEVQGTYRPRKTLIAPVAPIVEPERV